MAPNVVSVDGDGGLTSPLRESRDGVKGTKEIFYNGYFYDITDFINRHPGGNVIKFYTEAGEDATQAIDQFHFRSRKRVDAIMKGFKRRPAEPHERGLAPGALTRHEALSKDFKNLFEQLVAEGYFKPSIPHVILRLLEGIALTVFAYGIFFRCTTFLTKFLSVIFLGFAYSRYGWIQHESGHRSMTGHARIDRLIQELINGFLLGGSAIWWNSQHNRHHAMPQRLHHDVDLATLPYVAFNERTVKNRKDINRFFVRYQAIFYWSLDLMVLIIAWRLVLHPRYQLRKKAYFEMFLAALNLAFPIYMGLFWYLLVYYWFTFFLGINFALSHSHLDVADKPTHWLEYSLTHTGNITPSPMVDFWMGYLNYQIEHHLFPTMPQFRQKEIMGRVKALAEKYDLPYRVYSYPEACRLAYKNLNDVGKELTRSDHFD